MTTRQTRRRSLAGVLADYVVDLDPAAVPAATARHAELAILDTIGAALHAHGADATRRVQAHVAGTYGPGHAAVWGTGIGTSPAGAALSNGTSSHELELDDYMAPAKVHPGAVVVPAALATADPATSGAELFAAVVAGYEVMIRVGRALHSPSARRRGFHVTGLAGPMGAAAAAGRVLGLDADQITRALGIAGSRAGGLFAFTREGAMTKCLHAGMAAEAGVTAAALARLGVTGPSEVFEAADGGLLGAYSDDPRPDLLVDGLGERYAVDLASFKPYPCCAAVHSSIDAALAVRTEARFELGEVVSVRVGNSGPALHQCGFDYSGEGGALEARLSLQYCVAVALVDGAVGMRQFSEASRGREQVRRLARAVEFELDPEIERTYPEVPSAWVEVRLRSGQTLRAFVEYPLGNPAHPMPEELVERKFVEATDDLPHSAAVSALPKDLVDLRSRADIGFLIRAVSL